MITINFAHIEESMIVYPSVFTSAWVAIPLFIAGLLGLFLITHYALSFNIVYQIITFFVVCFATGFAAAGSIPALSVIAISLGMTTALLFVLTSLRL